MERVLLHFRLPLIVATACFLSFIWSIGCFFRQTEEMPGRMRVIRITGTLCIFLHMIGLYAFPSKFMLCLQVGTLTYLQSLLIFWWAIATTWRSRFAIAFSKQPSSAIVMTGPYRWVRHPFYAAYLLAWIAGGILIDSWWAWIPVVLMGLQYWKAITWEEQQFLSGELAGQYTAYSRRVRRLLPFVW